MLSSLLLALVVCAEPIREEIAEPWTIDDIFARHERAIGWMRSEVDLLKRLLLEHEERETMSQQAFNRVTAQNLKLQLRVEELERRNAKLADALLEIFAIESKRIVAEDAKRTFDEALRRAMKRQQEKDR